MSPQLDLDADGGCQSSVFAEAVAELVCADTKIDNDTLSEKRSVSSDFPCRKYE
jgi:hypothetical protein